jgi:tetratricopeptide (TPR) repeat protein
MFSSFLKLLVGSLLLACCWFRTAPALAKQPIPGGQDPGLNQLNLDVKTSRVEIYIKGPDGKPMEGVVQVTLVNLAGQAYRQATAKAGVARFGDVAATQYKVLVAAPGFERETREIDAEVKNPATVTILLRPMSTEDASLTAGLEALPPKAQKELGKSLAALHASNLVEARSHLESANKIAPNRAEVNYLFGLCSWQSKDFTAAKSYWTRTLELNPKHFLALLFLGQTLLGEDKAAEALPYLQRAVETEPTSWRAHAFLANAELRQDSMDDAIQHAERALELGHSQAESVQPFLAGALARRGDKARAVALLQSYLKDHPADAEAKKQLESMLTAPVLSGAAGSEGTSVGFTDSAMLGAGSLPEISNWLPPDIDEKVPAVEAGTACKIDDVLRATGKRIEEFIANVDRFAATESLKHENINKWGLPSSPEARKFDYLVSIREVKKGILNVEEFRTVGSVAGEFPDGIQTNGLPSMVLIFHPYNLGSFDLTCEGLARWNGGLAWQVHFRQRADKPNAILKYRLGAMGRSVGVPLKGRAWIAAETYQIVRLEAQMIAPLPEIRLAADYAAIEYGPVHFRERNLDMWLPKSAEVYSDWRGRRFHRRHSFSNYMLFSVDDQQHISLPKIAEETPPRAAPEAVKPNP